MEDKDLEKPEAAEETAVQPENVRALKEEPEKEVSYKSAFSGAAPHRSQTLSPVPAYRI